MLRHLSNLKNGRKQNFCLRPFRSVKEPLVSSGENRGSGVFRHKYKQIREANLKAI